ncbi:hypothetical protein [Streptomyces parvulus]|uniref:SLAC1 family transporter n=1 Tax=Streptomyces parvulus TaxID=146923 RepID=UPI0015F01E74|nr:hypothetical protein [Streptomyces parvulus]
MKNPASHAPPAMLGNRDTAGTYELRASRIDLLSISLATAGLGGAWRAAAGSYPGALPVSDGLYALSGLIWLLLVWQYLRHGGAGWTNLRHDIRQPDQGFTLSYVPVIGMLITGHFSRFGMEPARWLYALFAILAVLIAARVLAHWVTDGLDSTALHPGYLLPLSSAPLIASVTASVLELPAIADAAFAIGMLYSLIIGTIVLGRLVTQGRLPERARPTLTILTIPPAVGGIAWLVSHQGVVDAVAYGFTGVLFFTVVVIAFLLPELRQTRFHLGMWIFIFPVAATTNFTIRLVAGLDTWIAPALTWGLLTVATAAFVWLAGATLVHTRRTEKLKSAEGL